ncbi:MAG: hypothetical protein IKK21_04170 [Clostridia bacterium]|nr:hypothetical protein [Clostridia bacterium]
MSKPEAATEKVSVNMNVSTLSSIDLLVDEGYYSNRSDFINQAVREAVMRHQPTIEIIRANASMIRGLQWCLGLYNITPDMLKRISPDDPITLRVYGLLTIDKDCDENWLFACVKSITVRGKVIASDTVKAHYGL